MMKTELEVFRPFRCNFVPDCRFRKLVWGFMQVPLGSVFLTLVLHRSIVQNHFRPCNVDPAWLSNFDEAFARSMLSMNRILWTIPGSGFGVQG